MQIKDILQTIEKYCFVQYLGKMATYNDELKFLRIAT